ncbi:MAG: hypothetical protein FJ344_07220 [Sphingomonadales bacterium]|nr:hypothetical protein [Sphingomonadales bacterium]
MNQNRRRIEKSESVGFWSTLMGRADRHHAQVDNDPEESEPGTTATSVSGQWQWSDLSRHIPFIIYCTLLLLLYIANGHNQESMQRRILTTRQEVEDLKAEYILLQAEVMHLGRRSQVLDRLQTMGMGWKAPQDPPIELNPESNGTSTQKEGK